MKKIYTCIIGMILIISMVSGCNQADKIQEAPIDDALDITSTGEIKLDIINLNKYADIRGLNGPTGKVGLINKDETYFVRLTDGFSISDEGNIYVYVSEKKSLTSADDMKDGAYEVSILTEKEGILEYRIDDSVPADKINSVAFYKKEESALVAWAVFE